MSRKESLEMAARFADVALSDVGRLAEVLDLAIQVGYDKAAHEFVQGMKLDPSTHDPVIARSHTLVPDDMKCHKCGAPEPWKDAYKDVIAKTLNKLESTEGDEI